MDLSEKQVSVICDCIDAFVIQLCRLRHLLLFQFLTLINRSMINLLGWYWSLLRAVTRRHRSLL